MQLLRKGLPLQPAGALRVRGRLFELSTHPDAQGPAIRSKPLWQSVRRDPPRRGKAQLTRVMLCTPTRTVRAVHDPTCRANTSRHPHVMPGQLRQLQLTSGRPHRCDRVPRRRHWAEAAPDKPSHTHTGASPAGGHCSEGEMQLPQAVEDRTTDWERLFTSPPSPLLSSSTWPAAREPQLLPHSEFPAAPLLPPLSPGSRCTLAPG